MKGLMMDVPLTLQPLLERARRLHARRPIVTRSGVHLQRTDYGAWADRVDRLAAALQHLGVRRGTRVGTLAWNDARHLEATRS